MAKVWQAKDTYEHSDFNRIESVTRAAYEQFRKSLGLHREIITVTNRTIYSLLYVADFNRIESNLKYVDVTGRFEQKRWAEGSSFDFNDANRWERLADLLQRAITGVQTIRCGTAKCGTWPRISVIGLKTSSNDSVDASIASGTYAVTPTGTVPRASIVGLLATDELECDAETRDGTYAVIPAGTVPFERIIGIVTEEEIEASCTGATSLYAVAPAGTRHCGEEE